MVTRITSIVFVSLAVALGAAPQQQTPPPAQTPPPTATGVAKPAPPPATQTAPASAARPGNLLLTVFAESGAPLSGAVLSVRGGVDRGGTTSASGQVSIQNLPAGTYRGRISRDGFITLEKELVIRAGTRLAAEAVLSAAPASPAPPPPPPPSAPEPKPTTPVGPTGTPGVAKILSIPDLFQQMSRDAQPVVEREIGCSGNSSSRVILARQPITMHNHADADEMFYIVAGEGTLKVGDREENVGPGWFGLVPRGIVHSLTPRGRNAPFILSVRSGPSCG